MTVLQIHEGKKLLYRVLKVCEELCEPEMQFLYLKNSEADLRESTSSVSSCRFRCILLVFLQIVIVCVFGNLAKPYTQVTVTSEIVDFFQCFEECFLCQFLCNMGIVRKREQITVYDSKISARILPEYSAFVSPLSTSFVLLHIYDDICMGNVTKNFTKRKRSSDLWNTFFFFYKFLIHVHASSIHDWHSG